MFSFAIYDREKKELFLARDRVGQKPLKYYHDQNKFVFASELKAILTNPKIKKEPDLEAIDEYLTFKYIPTPKTGFKNIFKLPPAHYMIIKENGEKVLKKYWDLDYSEKLDLHETEWQEKITKKLKEAINLRLVSDVPLGAHLSGGIDSSLIVALMSEMGTKKIETFSIGFKERSYNELPYAKLVAEKYKTNHHEFIVKPQALEILPKIIYHYEEPYADPSAIPSWYLSQITKKHISVVLNGDGGDENFAGYERYQAMRLYYNFKSIPLKKSASILNSILYRLTNNKIFEKASRQLKADYSSLENFYLSIIEHLSLEDKNRLYSNKLQTLNQNNSILKNNQEIFANNKELNWLNQALKIGILTHLPDDLLVKIDIASMAHGLEIRSPFLDHELLELTAKMPSKLKLNGSNKKYILKKIAEKYLPHKCIYRPKQGFNVPLEYWFKDKLSKYIETKLLNKNFLELGFDKNYIKETLNKHKAGKENNENKLYSLLMLSLWFEEWM
jgi:asparagine synthase (glutamine-hydrolysing)